MPIGKRIAALIGAFIFTLSIEAEPTLRVGYIDYPPIIFHSSHNVLSGIGFDLLNAFAHEHKIRVEFIEFGDWDAVVAALKSGTIDAVPAMQRTAQREKNILFTAPYLQLPTVFIGHHDTEKKKSDPGVTIGVTQGSALETYLREHYPHAVIVPGGDSLATLTRVALREIDLHALNSGATGYYFNKTLFSQLEFKGVTGFEYQFSVGLSPRKKDLLEPISTFLRRNTALLEQSRARWQEVPRRISDTMLVLMGIGTGVLASLAIGLGLYLATRRTKKLRDDLDHTRAFLKQVFDTVPDLIFLKDAEGRFVFVNKAFAQLYGLKPEDISGQLNRSVHWRSSSETDSYLEADRRVLATGLPLIRDEKHTANDGQTLWFHTVKIPFKDANGAVGILGVSTDITERKAHEAELEKERTAATEANRVKTQFLAVMSHEIRTPMNAIIGLTDLLINSETSPGARALLRRVRVSANALTELLNDILDLSTFEAGNLSLSPAPTDVRQLVATIAEIYRPAVLDKGMRFSLVIDDDVPAHIEADALRLRQVLSNLLSNAVKFTKTGEVVVRVGIAQRIKPMLVFTVRDTGIGIAEATFDRIFQPFVQADASITRQYGGTGLGLAIARKLAEAMHGNLTVQSVPGQGSIFTFTLPLIKSVETYATIAEASQQPLKGKVLLVEDTELNRIIMKQMLNRLGLEVVEAFDGEDALAKFSPEFDLVLMDIHMPVLDGRAAATRIRQREMNGHHMPIIAVTAAVSEEDSAQCSKAGMDDFLPKPVDLESLRRMLAKYLMRQ